MARPRNADGQRTRQAILDAALELFADKGYFGTSLRDVAAAVGVRESALYNYFDGKDALFEALLAAHQDSRLERLSPLEDGPLGDGRKLLLRYASSTLDFYVEPREQKLFRILLSDGIRLARSGRINFYERMGPSRDWLHGLLRRLIREGRLREGDVSVMAIAFMSPLMTWRQLHAIKADLPMVKHPRVFARQHVDQFLQGAAATERAGSRPSPRRTPSRRRPS